MMESEREFLHSLANPAAAVQLSLEIIIEQIEKKHDEVDVESLLSRAKKALGSASRISELLKSRRNQLVGPES